MASPNVSKNEEQPVFERAVPILPSLDMDKSKAFYLRLGFELVSDYGHYLIFSKDSASLHIGYLPDKHVAENTSLYLYVRNIDQLHDYWQSLGVVSHTMELKPYGLKEFAVIDSSGNLLRVGERPVS